MTGGVEEPAPLFAPPTALPKFSLAPPLLWWPPGAEVGLDEVPPFTVAARAPWDCDGTTTATLKRRLDATKSRQQLKWITSATKDDDDLTTGELKDDGNITLTNLII